MTKHRTWDEMQVVLSILKTTIKFRKSERDKDVKNVLVYLLCIYNKSIRIPFKYAYGIYSYNKSSNSSRQEKQGKHFIRNGELNHLQDNRILFRKPWIRLP